ncbi:NACHT domain-containing protein [Endozoicomonas numazuensis]|uniref:NACHT domain-containing protein n=1 Tax=Endozoicomonas numazuensis TaxID=1137799 RepID=A0A081NLT4_9GAMM|nr:NACHT domain-containing protein [Endozoicomonas numazuensis]KEQ19407.1 hypothetical protein GZ78_05490 [Endozoicomonas numazuensis]
MSQEIASIDTVRASRAGHTFHERWAARRALQLVFPKDDLFAIAVEGLSTNETAEPGNEAEDIADLILYFGKGDTFQTCRAFQTLQFKYKATPDPVTSSYLKKTIKKFAATLLGYEKEFNRTEVDTKLTFSFVTNADFSEQLWGAIRCLKEGSEPSEKAERLQYTNLKKWCEEENVNAGHLCQLIEFRASTSDLSAQNSSLHKTLSDWTPGVDSQARMRLHGLQELVREKAGLSGQRNNLIKREDILDSLECEPEDLFPANTEFLDIGIVIEREALCEARHLIENSTHSVFINADGGVGKTVFIQSLANHMNSNFETVIFDCFGGGSYRAEDQARHLPKIGLLQIVNELASRGLCDPQLPSDGDRQALIKAARKRLEQAANTVKNQSSKSGVLVIIDAADNAQLAADHRKEDAFPRLLLASLSREPVDGVKIVLTARPHRMDGVIGRSLVERFELGAFSEGETRRFLETRRSDLNELEFTTALARSAGNARVLDYLVTSWNENISGSISKEKITVEELIRQRCDKIQSDLHLAGWDDDEIKQFFVAISLLPPPIPLDEMADALGWPRTKVNSAVADLAPLLELLKHGAIFRDEPTETFIRETYATEKEAQQSIADRLNARQVSSAYAAEALPHLLVVINDAQRAYRLSTSNEYPNSIQSEYGRRRLRLMRLHAAFILAAKERDYDHVLKLTMQLAQVAAANAKGDEFIRRLPGVSVRLGDQDASRRLFQDRSGWRGARDARLIVAFAFQEERDEAKIHQSRAIGWINWYNQNRREDELQDREGPSAPDLSAVLLLSILEGNYGLADRNIAKLNFQFALSVCHQVIALIKQYEALCGTRILGSLTVFASSKDCHSLALQVSLLASKKCLNSGELKQLSRATSTNAKIIKSDVFDNGYDYENKQQGFICDAAMTALIHGSRQSALNIVRSIKTERMSSYDYQERHSPLRIWSPILGACVSAWSAGNKLRFHHLLPREVRINRVAKTIMNRPELTTFLGELMKNIPSGSRKRGKDKDKPEHLFSRNECENIAKSVELVCHLAEPLQDAVLARRTINEHDFHDFLEKWKGKLRTNVHWRAENAQDKLVKNVGFGFAEILLQHATKVSQNDSQTLIDILSRGRFSVSEKLNALFLMARHENLQEQTGLFAQSISEIIRQDEYVDQRAEQYSRLAEALLPLSHAEAQQYFRDGLSQLDQMGGDDYDIIYSLLRYAAEQHGGWLQPVLGHRLMNLCQTIFQHEPSKFDWTLFGEAAAKSIGCQALFKLLRWADQDVSDFSYGLPQFVCYLAKIGRLDARRAAFILLLCEEQGWYNWKIGDGLKDIMEVAEATDRSAIFHAIFSKLKLEHPFGGRESLWNSLLEAAETYPGVVDQSVLNSIKSLGQKARALLDDENKRQNSFSNHSFVERSEDKDGQKEAEEAFEKIISGCDITSPHSIDKVIRNVRQDRRFNFNVHKRVIECLRKRCPYDKRIEFINMLAELVELDFDDAIEAIRDSVELWGATSIHITSCKKDFIRKIFETRGSELFDLRFTGSLREIKRLIDFCNDGNFVLGLVLDTVAKEKIELTGDEWLQLATALCPYTSGEANLKSLEDLLSGPAAKIGDEIGEGAFKSVYSPTEKQSSIVARITWHLLGNEKAFTRWTAARSVKSLADLDLHDDLDALLGCFGQVKVDALVSENMDSSFLNAEQWLLMGLSRASFYHGSSLAYLRDRFENLAVRDDIHVINKIHILRCLKNISGSSASSRCIRELEKEIYCPAKGYAEENGWPKPIDSKTGFIFDYEFNKHEVSSLARLFGISEGEATDAIAVEIQKRWPEAKDMDYFHGQERYDYTSSERHESYRDSVQRHALLNAATTLVKTRSVIRSSYEPIDSCPWIDWLRKYDVNCDNGIWLADRKDKVPDQAKEFFVTRSKDAEVLDADETLLRKIGVIAKGSDSFFPICGSWRSRDGVHVSISSALALRKGVIGQCKTFSQSPDHDIWLPRFDSDGTPDLYIRQSKFEPFIWSPEEYPIGIDINDEFATRFVKERERLGKEIIRRLGFKSSDDFQKWFTQDGNQAMKSQVWGQWRPDQNDHQRGWFQDEGSILWANSSWLDSALATLNRALVMRIDFHKYKSYRSYDDRPELRAVYIGLRKSDGEFRYWKAKTASKNK